MNPNHYKVAGRERQGEDILQLRNKQKLAESLARERFEPRLPNPAYTGPGGDTLGSEPAAAPAEPSAEQIPPANLTSRKKPAAPRRNARTAKRHPSKPGANKSVPARTARKRSGKTRTSATAGKRSAAPKRASSRATARPRPAATAGASRKKPSAGRRGKR